eukprot:CAMPEP_0184491566 /NCGR_PEP_ID=MMETSP0113_2-20130426/20720_1 /TAXON_ID=91329 /ORGANISM="Norrisiella sphaerica, Strain BC52" /LENGTH=601 /DNA_ID=CAMNT_0026875979 /DNA_START=270 /DNA_END=2072 /DNA_ORIENTATION=-
MTKLHSSNLMLVVCLGVTLLKLCASNPISTKSPRSFSGRARQLRQHVSALDRRVYLLKRRSSSIDKTDFTTTESKQRARDRQIISSSVEDEIKHRWLIPAVTTIGQLIEDINGSDEFNRKNPYFIRTSYMPPSREVERFEDMKVEGIIPPDLEGLFVWNCPVSNTWPPTHTTTNLCGHGMIHCVRFEKGAAKFASHVARTPTNKIERVAKFNIWGRPGDLRSIPGLLKLVLSKYIYAPLWGIPANQVGGANTNVVHYNNFWYAMEETMTAMKFDIDKESGKMRSLECEGFEYDTWDFPMCAHPKIDRKRNQLVVTGYLPWLPSAIIRYGVYEHGKLKTSFEFNLPGTDAPIIPFMHDMAITDQYSIVVDNSYQFSLPTIEGTGKILEFNPKRNAKFGVLPRLAKSASEIRWFDLGEALVINHIANSWEDPDDPSTIVLHAPVAYEGIDIFGHVGYHGHMTEFRLNLKSGKVSKVQYSSGRSCEFPRIRDSLVGLPTRYAYTVKHDEGYGDIAGLVKWDLVEKKLLSEVEFGPGALGLVGEPQFVPKKGTSGDEDDGYILTNVIEADNTTAVYIYDAKKLTEKPLVKLFPPERLAFGLHGQW